MEKKQKKEFVQIIVLNVFIVLFAISMIFTSAISSGIQNLLYKLDVRESDSDLIVHFINIGQGDAIALRFPNEEVMLIDAGPKDSQNHLVEYLKDGVLNSNNELIVDYLVLTHSDIDHSGGICAVFSEFEVKNFFRPNIASENEDSGDFAMTSTLDEYNEVIEQSQQEKNLNINIINQQYEFYIGDAFVQIFPPLKVYDTTNEMSPIIKVSYLGKSFLFTGDIQDESESDMLKHYGTMLDADVLKVAHHGSSSSTSEEFVEVVSPQYAIICVGENTYGHPHFNTIATLENAGAQIFTTKENTVRFVCCEGVFGVLDENKIHSYEVINWWVVALVIDLVLVGVLVKIVVKIIIEKKKKAEEEQLAITRKAKPSGF